MGILRKEPEAVAFLAHHSIGSREGNVTKRSGRDPSLKQAPELRIAILLG
ncbi:hypothetical protein H6F61_16375 [Cyanobacteria bacterium FACHB-472]|nr:hypothetical protein [Cyanobacteria bacterium FACHB-472]